ncbi:MAG: hypothetical protein J4215_00810, partial [Candidatus Diapherotrites archaeon]|nr:hypothetical protein [Candidatus Diapherotrites archaeon]
MWLLRVIVFLFLVGVFSASGFGFGTLETYTAKVCHPGDANVVWLTGTTYYLNVDNNVDVKGCMLTIQPGVVVKFKTGGTTYINVTTNGILKAQGSSDSKIIFTSRDDNSVGASVAESDGVPQKADYSKAINFAGGSLRLVDTNDLFDLNIGYAKTALGIGNMYSVHDSVFHDNNVGSGMGSGVYCYGTITSVYDNLFEDNIGDTVYCNGGVIYNMFNNTFLHSDSTYNSHAVVQVTGPINIYNNVFSNSATGARNGIYLIAGPSGEITASIYNNLFKNNSRSQGGAIYTTGTFQGSPINSCTGRVTISTLSNNTFFDNNANSVGGGAVYNGLCGQITNARNNIFAFNTGTAVVNRDANGSIVSNFNAFWGNDANGSGYTEGAESVYLGASPFTGDASDRNFLLNSLSNGGALLVNTGDQDSNGVDINNFFNLRTTQLNNKLDTQTIDIGYHYDQNAPYVQVLSPSDSNT